MTVREAIDRVRRMKPCDFKDETLVEFLNDVEKDIQVKVYKLPLDKLTGYCLPQDDNTTLLVPPPFDKVYKLYMAAQIDLYRGEYTNYMNTSEAYNKAVGDFHAYYMREIYKPKGGCLNGTGT